MRGAQSVCQVTLRATGLRWGAPIRVDTSIVSKLTDMGTSAAAPSARRAGARVSLQVHGGTPGEGRASSAGSLRAQAWRLSLVSCRPAVDLTVQHRDGRNA